MTHELAGTAADQQLEFGYNPASQIITRIESNDAYAIGTPDAARSYHVNGLNQYTSVAGVAHAYDLNGNLTSDGATNFVYDAENRLVSASGAKAATLPMTRWGDCFSSLAEAVRLNSSMTATDWWPSTTAAKRFCAAMYTAPGQMNRCSGTKDLR